MVGVGEGGDPWLLTLQNSPIGMATVGLDGRLLMFNAALTEMLGYDEEQLKQHGFQELTHPDDLDADLEHFQQTLAGEIDSYRMLKRYLRPDGRIVWGDLSVALVRDADGAPLHFVSQILDVTEQQEAQARLEAATAEAELERQMLEAIFETVSVGLLLIDGDGKYQRMNRHHQETMRLPFPDGHQGEAGQLGYVFHLDGTTRMRREEMPSYRAAQGEEFDDYTYWVGSDPATRLAFSTSARQVRGPSGERRGAALAYQEITDLVRAMQVKGEFVASVSHELRTPLTSVLGYLEVLCDREDLPSKVRDQLRVVRRNAQRLQVLVSDLLQVGQADVVGPQLERSEVDLVTIVRDAVEQGRREGETVGVAVSAELPDRVSVCVDQERIRQVLDNLVSNAVKYTPAGGRVTVVLREAGDDVVVEVCDTGIGIAPEELGHVFDRFYRGAQVRSQQIPGTGLGLDIVHSIVAAHGGAIDVDSEPGRGSTFCVTLPRDA